MDISIIKGYFFVILEDKLRQENLLNIREVKELDEIYLYIIQIQIIHYIRSLCW
jgi:hypothetical protein